VENYNTFLEEQNYKIHHASDTFLSEIVLKFHRSQRPLTETNVERIDMSKKLYNLELKFHDGDVGETLSCLKRHIDQNLLATILQDVNPGLMRKYCMPLVFLVEKLHFQKTLWWFFKVPVNVSFIYIDILKDSVLLVTLFIIVGGYKSLLQFPTHLPTVVFLCQLVSVLSP